MNLILFCTAFILQFVGHRIGDYLFQTDWQAQNKAKNAYARLKHVLVYSFTITLIMAIQFDYVVLGTLFLITFTEHMIIDSRSPVVWWKKTLEKVVRNKGFNIDNMPFFVLIEIDQTVHYTRIFIISLLIGYGVLT